MIIQITNTTRTKFNQCTIEVDDEKQIAKAVSAKKVAMGWVGEACTTKQLRDELVKTKYRGADGKSIGFGKTQTRQRVKSARSVTIIKQPGLEAGK